jgi:hypothetical protein
MKHCRTEFPKDIVKGALEAFKAFMGAFSGILHSPTEEDYNERLEAFKERWPPVAVKYCEDTWFTPWKELLVSAWVDQYMHFGHTETSRVEGAHSCLKATIRVSTADLFAVYQKIALFWARQHEIWLQQLARAETLVPQRAYQPFFACLIGKVYPNALNKVIEQASLEGPLTNCSGTFSSTWGLPCWHKCG